MSALAGVASNACVHLGRSDLFRYWHSAVAWRRETRTAPSRSRIISNDGKRCHCRARRNTRDRRHRWFTLSSTKPPTPARDVAFSAFSGWALPRRICHSKARRSRDRRATTPSAIGPACSGGRGGMECKTLCEGSAQARRGRACAAPRVWRRRILRPAGVCTRDPGHALRPMMITAARCSKPAAAFG